MIIHWLYLDNLQEIVIILPPSDHKKAPVGRDTFTSLPISQIEKRPKNKSHPELTESVSLWCQKSSK